MEEFVINRPLLFAVRLLNFSRFKVSLAGAALRSLMFDGISLALPVSVLSSHDRPTSAGLVRFHGIDRRFYLPRYLMNFLIKNKFGINGKMLIRI